MKYVSKTIFAAAALATLASFSMGGVAQAAIVAGSEVCGPLPNVKWSWVITSDTSTSGGDTSTTVGDVSYNTAGNVGKADVTTATTAIIETTINTCTALNPAGVPNADHSTSTTTTVEIAPATSSTTNEVVCNPGASLPSCPL